MNFNIPILDLETKGFLLIPNFLNQKELVALEWDSIHGLEADDKNFQSRNISPHVINKILLPKINKILDLVKESTNIKVDFCDGGFYADTTYVNFPWHQDHGVYYIYQQATNYLNFYLMVKKEKVEISNITILPFDKLQELAPTQINNIIGRAAQRFVVKDNITEVIDDDLGTNHYILPFDIETIAYTPHLKAGDLLLLRGDVPHKTQDNLTPRLAATLRFAENSTIYKDKLLSTCKFKSNWMSNTKDTYTSLFEAFDYFGRDSITIKEYREYAEIYKNLKID